MKINVSDLLKAVGNELDVEEKETVSYPEDGLDLVEPAQIKVHLVNTGETILMTGTLKTKVRLKCSRCLNDFEELLSAEIREEYLRTPQKVKGRIREIELREEDFVFKINDDNTIDLGEAMRQNLLLALPIKPLCNKNCKLKEL